MKKTLLLSTLLSTTTALAATASSAPPPQFQVTCHANGREVFQAIGVVSFPRNGGVKIKLPNGDEHYLKAADECRVKRKDQST